MPPLHNGSQRHPYLRSVPHAGFISKPEPPIAFTPFPVSRVANADQGHPPRVLTVEIFVQPRFSQLELSSITSVLNTANDVQNSVRFDWNFCSDTPGLVANGNFLVRAEPAIEGDVLKDCLIIVGGDRCTGHAWIKRVRSMQRHNRPVVLFSDAATEFVKVSGKASYPATTHWRDIPILSEIGDYSGLSTRLAEYGNGVLTCAGRGHALEATFSLVSDLLAPHEKSELASLLIMDGIRGFHREQPKGHAAGSSFLEAALQRALHLMEETIDSPLPISALAKSIGTSPRQLQRLFRIHLNCSPAKMYKNIRLKRAWTLIVETRMPLLNIAIACGFPNTPTLSKAFRHSYGMSPNHLRAAENGSSGASLDVARV